MWVKARKFTIIELMVVVSIFVILMSLLQPSLKKMMASSNHIVCENNLKQVAGAMTIYIEDYDQSCPGPMWDGQKSKISYTPDSLAEFVAPYMKTTFAEDGQEYLAEMTCPSNSEIELDPVPYDRVQFRAVYISGFGRPFGRPINSNKATVTLPKSIHEIPDPSQNIAIEEADYYNYPYQGLSRMSAVPVHFGLIRNTMYFDARVEAVEFIP